MKNFTKIFLLFLTLISFSSCKKKTYTRINLAENLLYLETASHFKFEDVKRTKEFNELPLKKANKLNSLLTTEQNYIWIKAEFTIPDELKNKDLGLCVAYLRSAGEIYLNDYYLDTVGKMPPHEFSTGLSAHYSLLQKTLLNQDGVNTIYIKVFPGLLGAISTTFFISEVEDSFITAENISFANSKILLICSGVMFLVFILYIIMFFGLRKIIYKPEYLTFALLNFYTIHFLLPFSGTEIPFISKILPSYLFFVKTFILSGAYFTSYFAGSFILKFIKHKQTVKQKLIRLGIVCLCVLVTLCLPSYTAIVKVTPFIIAILISEFSYFVVHPIVKLFFEPKQRKLVIRLFIVFSPVLITILIDFIARIFFKNHTLPFFTIYGWQATIIVNLVYLVISFNHTYTRNAILKNKLEEFNSNLEEIVSLRTKELSDANFVLSRGLEAVSNVQKNFLPPQKRCFKGWDIAVSYTPLSDEVSGDLFDYYFTNNDLHGVGIFDVSGHGISAGLMTILAKGIISQNFVNSLSKDEPLSKTMSLINDNYIHEKVNVENYITGLLFKFSEISKKDICNVELSNAGHPYPLFYSSETNTVSEIKYKNLEMQYGMLGIEDLPVSFPSTMIKTKQDDIIVAFTDGLTEAKSTTGKTFEPKKIEKIILSKAKLSADEILQSIISSYLKFTENSKILDDVTIIVLKRTKSADFIEEL